MSGFSLAVLTVIGVSCGLCTSWLVERRNSPWDERRCLGKLLLALSAVELSFCWYYGEAKAPGLSLLKTGIPLCAGGLTFGGTGWMWKAGPIWVSALALAGCTLALSTGGNPLQGWAVCLGLCLPLLLQGAIQHSLLPSWGLFPTIKSFDWFAAITGCDEAEFRQNLSRFIQPAHAVPIATAAVTASNSATSSTNTTTIPSAPTMTASKSPVYLAVVNPFTNEKYHAGQFTLTSLGQLRREVLQAEGLNEAEIKTSRSVLIELICKCPSNRNEVRSEAEWRRELDVAAQQSDPKYRNAVFQVASNFNAIEAIRESAVPEKAEFARDYYSDLTQGPTACISAGAGAITRIYAPFYDPQTPPSQWNQTSTRQINFLCGLSEYFPVQNGYVTLTKPKAGFGADKQDSPRESASPLPSDEKELSALEDKVLVAYHRQIQVTSGHRPRGQDYAEVVLDREQCIDQVLCAALNIGQGLEGRYNRLCDDVEAKAKFLLKVAYEGAYLVAIKNGRTVLVLTLIGGGVFNTPHEWIVEAIVTAHLHLGQHAASSLQRVVVNLHTNSYLLEPVCKTLQEKHIAFCSQWV